MAIAEKLGEVLQTDLEAGLNHLAMARCQTIDRAKDLHQLYCTMFPEFRPVIVHSQQSTRERRANLAALRRFERSCASTRGKALASNMATPRSSSG